MQTAKIYALPVEDNHSWYIVVGEGEMDEDYRFISDSTPFVEFTTALTESEMAEPLRHLTDTGKSLITTLMGTDFKNYRIERVVLRSDSFLIERDPHRASKGEARSIAREALEKALGANFQIEFVPTTVPEAVYA